MRVYGSSSADSGNRALGIGVSALYIYDIKVETTPTSYIVSQYINTALIATITAPRNPSIHLKPMSLTFGNESGENNISEIIIANEDTRGMRVRELRPTSYGVHQEWDGSVTALRDDDLATGITTELPNQRASFGVSNLTHVRAGDAINRVVMQTYAQRGLTGPTKFNHFFRYGDGTIVDSAEIPLDIFSEWHLEDFSINPKTGVSWTGADLLGIQTGIRSLA